MKNQVVVLGPRGAEGCAGQLADWALHPLLVFDPLNPCNNGADY